MVDGFEELVGIKDCALACTSNASRRISSCCLYKSEELLGAVFEAGKTCGVIIMVSICGADVAAIRRKAGHKQNPRARMGPLSCAFQQLRPISGNNMGDRNTKE